MQIEDTADTATAEPTAIIQQAPRNLLLPDPNQPRKRFVPNQLMELATSIRSHGILMPILCRPNPGYVDGNGQPHYMIVSGECRWRAAGLADLVKVPFLLRHLTDFQVAEIQLTENLQRNNLHPLEEAEALARMLRSAERAEGYENAEALGAHLGKSRRWVYNRVVLLNLSEDLRIRFMAEEFSTSIAQRLAVYVHDHAEQPAALKRILAGFGGEPMSVRAAEDYLRKEFTLRLDGARFDVLATYTHAGPCGACPKRTGANPDLFDDAPQASDLCQDRTCFEAKVAEQHERNLTAARDMGATVYEGAEALKFMPRENVMPTGFLPFHGVAAALTADKRLLSEIFGAKARGVVVVDRPHSATLQWLVAEADARKVLKAKGLLRPEAPKAKITPAAAAGPAPSPAPSAPQGTSLLPILTDQQVKLQIAQVTQMQFGNALFAALHQALVAAPELPLIALRRHLKDMVDYGELTAEALELMYDARGWEPVSQRDFEQRVDDSQGRELGELFIEALYARELAGGLDYDDMQGSDDHCSALAEHFAVPLEDLQRQAIDEATAEVEAEQAKRKAARVGKADAGEGGGPHTVKYRNAATGEAWSGRGLQPAWLKAALSNGKRLADFEVSAKPEKPKDATQGILDAHGNSNP